jgi:hypothetical protein
MGGLLVHELSAQQTSTLRCTILWSLLLVAALVLSISIYAANERLLDV